MRVAGKIASNQNIELLEGVTAGGANGALKAIWGPARSVLGVTGSIGSATRAVVSGGERSLFGGERGRKAGPSAAFRQISGVSLDARAKTELTVAHMASEAIAKAAAGATLRLGAARGSFSFYGIPAILRCFGSRARRNCAHGGAWA